MQYMFLQIIKSSLDLAVCVKCMWPKVDVDFIYDIHHRLVLFGMRNAFNMDQSVDVKDSNGLCVLFFIFHCRQSPPNDLSFFSREIVSTMEL